MCAGLCQSQATAQATIPAMSFSRSRCRRDVSPRGPAARCRSAGLTVVTWLRSRFSSCARAVAGSVGCSVVSACDDSWL